MKRSIAPIFSCLLLFICTSVFANDQQLQAAFQSKQSDIQVSGVGQVIVLLKDDLKGSRHQRFIVKLDSSQTLLIAHNIDLAPRINGLKKGDRVAFYGEYTRYQSTCFIQSLTRIPRQGVT